MPNVKGLDPAPILLASLSQGERRPYGPHASVILNGTSIAVLDALSAGPRDGRYGRFQPSAKADLARMD